MFVRNVNMENKHVNVYSVVQVYVYIKRLNQCV